MKPGEPAIKLSKQAAAQVKKSAQSDGMESWPLRIAVRQDENKKFHYAMGFDNQSHEDDISFKSEGVEVVVMAGMLTLLKGMTVDYVELEKGKHHFIFMNPNDPAYVPPES